MGIESSTQTACCLSAASGVEVIFTQMDPSGPSGWM